MPWLCAKWAAGGGGVPQGWGWGGCCGGMALNVHSKSEMWGCFCPQGLQQLKLRDEQRTSTPECCCVTKTRWGVSVSHQCLQQSSPPECQNHQRKKNRNRQCAPVHFTCFIVMTAVFFLNHLLCIYFLFSLCRFWSCRVTKSVWFVHKSHTVSCWTPEFSLESTSYIKYFFICLFNLILPSENSVFVKTTTKKKQSLWCHKAQRYQSFFIYNLPNT